MQDVQSDTRLKIGDASSADLLAIVKLALNTLWNEYKSYDEAEKAYREQVTVRWQRQLEHRHARIIVAKIPDKIMGFLVFRWWFSWNGWLETIVVDEKHRRKGIGTKRIHALMEKARSEGYKAICFGAKDGEAVEFWAKFEAQKFGEIQDTDPGKKLPLYYVSL